MSEKNGNRPSDTGGKKSGNIGKIKRRESYSRDPSMFAPTPPDNNPKKPANQDNQQGPKDSGRK